MRAIVIPMLAAISSMTALAQAQSIIRSGPNEDVEVIGTASGTRRASDLLEGCAGYIPEQPDYLFTQERPRSFLRLFTRSGTDLALVVQKPDGTYVCDDDSGPGLNPAIDVTNPGRGTYRVWVGVYRANTVADYTLTFTSSREPLED